jgi:5-methylcytosine-specific restriction endonuclease McrA
MATLILNADAAPISMLPLSTITWEESIKYLVLDKATVLEWYDDWVVHSVNWSTRVPAVMMLKEYQKKKTAVRFSKQNVFLRDQYCCQYCGIDIQKRHATLDHVLPVSHGGKSTFENCTTACGPCNAGKGANKKIKPKSKPHKPEYWELVNKRKHMPFQIRHDAWMPYIK